MKLVDYSVNERIGWITLSRPEKRNALSFELVSELKAAFTEAETDERVKVVVLKSTGDAFCAGADLGYLKELQHYSFEENLQDSRHLKDLFLQIYTLRKVVIAQVQGPAIAGGCGLACVCDFAFTVPKARFGYTEVKIGFIPALVSVFLLRKVGEQRAKQLLLGGDLVSGEQALSLGLVNGVAEPDQLAQVVLDFARKLVKQNSAHSMELTKGIIAKVQDLPLQEALEYAASVNARARSTDDCRKGVQAFLDKKDLNW